MTCLSDWAIYRRHRYAVQTCWVTSSANHV